MRYFSKLIIFLLFFNSPLSHADWVKGTHTSFSGKTYSYFINRASNGAEITVLPDAVIFSHRKTVINYMEGMKLDGVYEERREKPANGDDFTNLVIAFKEDSEMWNKILGSKKIEVNVNYFKTGFIVSTFNSRKSLKELFPSNFPE